MNAGRCFSESRVPCFVLQTNSLRALFPCNIGALFCEGQHFEVLFPEFVGVMSYECTWADILVAAVPYLVLVRARQHAARRVSLNCGCAASFWVDSSSPQTNSQSDGKCGGENGNQLEEATLWNQIGMDQDVGLL